MHHARHQQNLGYQSLETRKMLAGDITVVEDGHLYIRGDAADNQFEVVAVGEELRVNGLQGTTINGQESYLVAGARVTDAGVAFAGGLRAHLGPGSDDLMIQDAVFESYSIIRGGTGDDNIEVIDTDFMEKVVLQTYDGNDSVSTTRSHFEGPLFVYTLDGQDSVSMTDSMFAGNSFVVTGNHSDAIESDGNHYMGEVNLILPLNGNDTVQLNNPVVEESQLGIFLGNHDDTIGVDLTEALVEGTIRIGGQAGRDQAVEMEMNEVSLDYSDGSNVRETRVGGQGNFDRIALFSTADQAEAITVRTFERNSIAVNDLKRQEVFSDLIVSGARLGTVTELARVTPELSTLTSAVIVTQLAGALNDTPDLTVFAPLNSAFESLPAGTLERLTDEQLVDILQFHVVTEPIFAGDLVTRSSVDTLLGQSFSVEVNDAGVLLNGNVTLAATDIRAKNGVVHLLNEVLIPVL